MSEVHGEEKKRAEIYRDGLTSPYLSSVCRDRIEFASTPASEPELFHARVFRNYAERIIGLRTKLTYKFPRRILFPIENFSCKSHSPRGYKRIKRTIKAIVQISTFIDDKSKDKFIPSQNDGS